MSSSVPIQLSTVKPDFASLLLQLQLYLQTKETWIDLQTSATGETLMEMMSAVGAFNQFGIESALRETSLLHARRDSSIYAITRMLGVRIHRKSPASVGVDLIRTDTSTSIVIPRFTQFSINGQDYFSRNPLSFARNAANAAELLFYGVVKPIDARSFRMNVSDLNTSVLNMGDKFLVTVNSGAGYGESRHIQYMGPVIGGSKFTVVTGEADFTELTAATRMSFYNESVFLYQGTVQTDTFISDGTNFQQMYLTPKNFEVSDTDVKVVVVNPSTNIPSEWSNIDGGIWEADSQSHVYYDSTSGYGEAIIAFGDSEHGTIPPLGSRVQVTYASTSGSLANNGLTSFKVACPTLDWLTGVTTTVISGGADEKPASFYRQMAPRIYKARRRAVTDSDYEAAALDYPGIISAGAMAQRDIAPGDLRWMNVVQLCVLPIDTSLDGLTDSEWGELKTYMFKRTHAAVYLRTLNPTRLDVELDITVALKAAFTSSGVMPLVEAAVRSLFARRADTLGRRITMSDIVYAAKSVEGVDYVDVDICRVRGTATSVNDLIPPDKTNFLSLYSYLANVKYSERLVY